MVGLLVALLFMLGVYYVMLGRSFRVPVPSGTRAAPSRRWASTAGPRGVESALNGLLAAMAAATIATWAELGVPLTIVLGAAIGILAGWFGPVEGVDRILDLVYSGIGVVALVPALAAVTATGDCLGTLGRGGRIAALVVLVLCTGAGLVAGWYRRNGSLAKAGLGVFALVEVLLLALMPISGSLTGSEPLTLLTMMALLAALGGLVGFWADLAVPVLAAGLALVSFYDATVGLFPACGTGSSTDAVLAMAGFAVALTLARRILPRR